ncbi:hypothetical protein Ae201684P_004532 [Aphanomyces euteiches]|uniref:Magnesium transporter protein 1 n=1 Tax=Aphanomyces euteiches TaxID=100861 RepID=A0A6G0W812_9STRA|nr:hypothetical protein Ae201684_018248 [Aphanomyces euteiches]KAH9068833.1 hypothetical protein Ae201684P_004532 [Aphanomyces euteiches]
MRGLWIAAALFLSIVWSLHLSGEIKPALTGAEKIAMLRSRSENGLISLTSEVYHEFATGTDRPYHLFLLLTAMDEKYKCEICWIAAPEYEILAQSIATSGERAIDGLEIFFGVVDFDTNRQAFSMLGFTTAPQIVHLDPNLSVSNRGDDSLSAKIELPASQVFNIYTQGKSAESFLSFVRSKTGVQAEIVRSKVIAYITVGGSVLLFTLIVYAIATNFQAVLNRIRRKQLWLIISLLFYGLSVSGMVYCIVREPPPYLRERSGQITFFHRQGRQQYVAEGLIVGALDLTSAGCIIALSQVAVHVRSPILRYAALFACLGGFIISYKQMVLLYAYKNPWFPVNLL